MQRQADPGVSPGTASSGRGSRGSAAMLSVQRMAGNRAAAGLMRDAITTGGPQQHAKSKVSVTVTGDKQGRFKGGGKDGAIEAFGYHVSIVAPRDAGTGVASGRRQHKGVTFKKPPDGSSPQFMNAVDNNENLSTVTIKLVVGKDGKDADLETVVLTNAAVVGFDQEDTNGTDVETVTLVYEKLDLTNEQAKTSASDTWSSPAG